MNNIIWEAVPLYHEIMLDEESMSISFSLCPEANDYLFEILGRKSRMTDYLKAQEDFSPFSFPGKDGWGFGRAFRMNNTKSIEKDWITWECLLPRKAMSKKLQDISGSIHQLITCLALFSFDKKGIGSKDKMQLMTIDGIVVTSENVYHSGAFDFSYARPVLDFCARILGGDKELHDAVGNAMQKIWAHLAGEKKVRSYDKYSFRISECQGDARLISLSCPGNCA